MKIFEFLDSSSFFLRIESFRLENNKKIVIFDFVEKYRVIVSQLNVKYSIMIR